MKQHAELPPHFEQLPLVHARDAFPFDQHVAFIRPQQSDQVFQQNALAAAAPADDDHRFAFFHAQVHAIQHALRPEAFFQLPRLDHHAPSRRVKNSVRKKLLIKIVMHEYTTASVVARPTPSAPSRQFIPL